MTEPDALSLDYVASQPQAAAGVLERLGPGEAAAFLVAVPVRLAADPLARMLPWHAGRCLQHMTPEQAAALVEALPSARGAYCLRVLADEARRPILDALPRNRARALRRQLRYSVTLVGAHMDPEATVFPSAISVAEARAALAERDPARVLQIHLTDAHGCPQGAIAPGLLWAAGEERRLSSIADRACPSIPADLPLAAVSMGGEWLDWPERPVVDSAGRLVGQIGLARLLAARSDPLPTPACEPAPSGVLIQCFGVAAMGLIRAFVRLVHPGLGRADVG